MDSEALKAVLDRIQATLQTPFWQRPDFVVSILLSMAGCILSGFGLFAALNARDEAQSAKDAAREAGSAVKIQTVVIELTEVSQKLNRLEQSVSYSAARDVLNEVSQKIRRLVSPYSKHQEIKETIEGLLKALTDAQTALKSVQPTMVTSQGSQSTQQTSNFAVYYAVEGVFMNISGLIGDLIGLLENMSVPHVENDHGG